MSMIAENYGQRRHERVDISLDVSLEGDHNFFTGLTENISEGGLFVATHSLREIGSTLVVEFSLPGQAAPIRAECVVCWLRIYNELSDGPPGIGVQFVGLTDADAEAIRGFVTRREPLFWD